jgi:hypothetical protein
MKPAKLIPIVLAACLVLPGLSSADEKSHREQVAILFKLTKMEQKVNESVASVAQLQIRQNPELELKYDQLMDFLNRHIGWYAMLGDITEMYMQTFSEEELKVINDFYITTTGQKVITLVPQLVQERNQLAMQRLQQNIGELQQIMSGSSPH